MKNLKVWIKLGIGFGLVLCLMCALGIQAIMELREEQRAAETIAEAFMPELTLAVRFERAAQLSAQSMLQFVSSGDERFYAESQKQMNNLSTVAKEAESLVVRYPFLSNLAKNLKSAQQQFIAYSKAAEQTHTIVVKLNARQAKLQQAATDFFAILTQTITTGEEALEAEITGGSSSTEIFTRFQSVKLLNDCYDLGNAIDAEKTRAQAQSNPDMAEKALPLFETLKENFAKLMANALPQNRERVQNVERVAEVYRAELVGMINEWRELKRLTEDRSVSMAKLLTDAQNTATEGIRRVQALCDEASNTASKSMFMLELGLCLGVLLGLLCAWILTRMITKPLDKSVNFAVDVANGNLGHTLDIDQADEIGKLSVALNSMVRNLASRIKTADEATTEANQRKEEATQAMREADEARLQAENAKRQGMLDAATQLGGVVVSISSASEQLSAQVEQASRGATKQAARVSETAASMDEMNSSVLDVARNAGITAEVSSQARTKAAAGAQAVNQVVAGMDRINAGAKELREDMNVLSDKAESIGNILNVISDIADQTNLLALNAAIEAARAGEAGRGFAVVADEVRKLAEKTMQATSEVGQAIRGIQEGTAMNMAKVENTVDIVNEVAGLATDSGAALSEIVTLVDQASEQIRAIAAASEEQSATSDSISRSITEVNRIASETEVIMQESGRAVGDLNEQARVLSTLITNMQKG